MCGPWVVKKFWSRCSHFPFVKPINDQHGADGLISRAIRSKPESVSFAFCMLSSYRSVFSLRNSNYFLAKQSVKNIGFIAVNSENVYGYHEWYVNYTILLCLAFEGIF